MPATVFCNLRTVVHKGSGDTSIAFPDVCMTPCAPSPVPIPYPNIAQSSDAAKTASTVLADGNPIMVKDSHYAQSTGDEAGNAPGNVVTGVIKGKAYFTMYSFDVMAEGKNVCRFLDPMTHNHSSSPPPGTPPGPDIGGTMSGPTTVKIEKDRLAGDVKSVTLQSGIPLESKGITGPKLENPFPAGKLPPSGPNWERVGGKPPPREKSYPAVYTMACKNPSEKKMQVVLTLTQVEGKYEGKQALLVGQYLDLEIRAKSKITLKEGETGPIDCEFVKLPNRMRYDAGAGILWDLQIDGFKNPVCVGFTTIEIFFISGKPQSPWSASKPARYEALKFAFDKLMVGDFAAPLGIIDYVTRGLHRCGIRYDTEGGANRYGWFPPAGGTFKITKFLRDIANLPAGRPGDKTAPGPKVNCYDMAGLVDVFGALLGVEDVRALFLGTARGLPFVYMFGYINATFLVGIYELCNNPFFDGNFTRPQVANDDANRTAFGNHAFPIVGLTVFDACAGPFKGKGGIKMYTYESIDARRTARDQPGWEHHYLWAQSAMQFAVTSID